MAEKEPEFKCPLCDFRPRAYKNDNPATTKDRLYAHIHLNHRKEELIRAIFILAGWEEKEDLWKRPPIWKIWKLR